jgi:RNA polymerase sigma factor (sigma-70 family)
MVIAADEATNDRIAASFSDASATDFLKYTQPFLAKMLRLAQRLGGRANRDDIVQEALINAWNKRSQFNSTRGSLGPWLMAIVADQARKTWRRRLRPLSQAPIPAESSAEDRMDLKRAIGRLPARQRIAVECHYFADLDVAETAAVMRCSEGTVKATLSHARANLRAALEVGND